MMSLKRARLAAVICMACTTVLAQPLGSAVSLSSNASSKNVIHAVSTAANGDQLVAWFGRPQNLMYFQRFGAGNQLLQSSEWASGDTEASLTLSPAGDVAQVRMNPNFGPNNGVYFRVWNRAGQVVAAEQRADGNMGGNILGTYVFADPRGGYVVAWMWQNTSGNTTLFGRRYSAAGTPLTGVMPLGDPSVGNTNLGDGFIDVTGQLTITLDRTGTRADMNAFDVYHKRFDANLQALGPATRVNSHTADFQGASRIAANSKGDFVVAWESVGQDSTTFGSGVYAQRFNSGGVHEGVETRLNVTTEKDQGTVDVGMAEDGSFVTTWLGLDAALKWNLYGRAYDSFGTPLTSEYVIRENMGFRVVTQGIAMRPDGSHVVAWADFSAAGHIEAQQFTMDSQTPLQQLSSGQFVPVFSGKAGSWRYYAITVPAGVRSLSLDIAASSGNPDIYLRRGGMPTASQYELRPATAGTSEHIQISNPPAAKWYIGVFGSSDFTAANMQVQYSY